MPPKIILGASIGNCVHVAGVYHFLSLAEKEGYKVCFLGPAVSPERLFNEINKIHPDVIGIGFRLTPENVIPLLDEICDRAKELDYTPTWVFGGTRPVAQKAKKYKLFSFISDGFDDIDDSIRFLKGETGKTTAESYGKTLSSRIEKSYPYPILRHHFGNSSVSKTIEGIEKISKAKVLDVISIGPDQNAQEFFFQPSKMQKQFDGSGGVPIRTADDLRLLKKASLCGNFPLMRCYSGTADVFQYAEMLVDTIDNAWTAVPLFWYNELDGRGTRTLETSIHEAQQLIRWHVEKGVPVEINEPHHWGLRDAHDVMSVATAYIAAYNAKALGVREYVSQYMFNNPNGLSFSMDFARILAMLEMVEKLEDETFKTYRETRAGLPLFHVDANIAKGQLAASTFLQMEINPHIVHVVGFCEADHAATAKEVIESCKIVRGVIRHTLGEDFAIAKAERILARKEELVREAGVLIDFIRNNYDFGEDPLLNPKALAMAVKQGALDAVHILKNSKFRGNLLTTVQDGKCVAMDKQTKELLSETKRLAMLPK